MRVLLTGASGFIGRALATALEGRGHVVVRAVRQPQREGDVRMDFADVPTSEWWRPHLQGIDAVVNAVGILREHGRQTFRALHTEGPAQLFRAAAEAGVPTVVQVSALGADAGARSAYHLSKRAADDVLRGLPVRGAVVQPSLVYGEQGSSAALFNKMAVAPLLPFPAGGRMLVHPVHVDDVVAGLVALVERPPAVPQTLAFAGPRPMALREYLADLRTALGEPGPMRVLPVPVPLFRAGAGLAGHVPGSMLDSDTADMLLAGNATDANGLPALLGRAPRAPLAFIAPERAEGQRRQAVLDLWLPALQVALALLWIWTGVVTLGLYPQADSLALLAPLGLQGAAAKVVLYGAAGVDIALGILTLVAPARWRRTVWATQLVLVVGYTIVITAFLPAFWLHPYGPISKNLPILAAIALLWALEPARR